MAPCSPAMLPVLFESTVHLLRLCMFQSDMAMIPPELSFLGIAISCANFGVSNSGSHCTYCQGPEVDANLAGFSETLHPDTLGRFWKLVLDGV